ncbi:unnamed protein product [Hydatigera taeniaeformis]|uniref:Fibronectin type-III domain-containing protein n=1 Tax=Hydatigena taeniaeformis TaxID=6205 RepID=A0A0R3XA16_HYDTA|nr:unnamed protein product [Hydatigera taeniaeformis]
MCMHGHNSRQTALLLIIVITRLPSGTSPLFEPLPNATASMKIVSPLLTSCLYPLLYISPSVISSNVGTDERQLDTSAWVDTVSFRMPLKHNHIPNANEVSFVQCVRFGCMHHHTVWSAGDTCGSVWGGKWLESSLRWFRGNHNTMKLMWNVLALVKHNVEFLTVSARPLVGTGRTVKATVGTEVGQLVLRNLKPNTLYVVKVEAYRDRVVLADYETRVYSWPTGEIYSSVCFFFRNSAFTSASHK